jgi:hypothetical protein
MIKIVRLCITASLAIACTAVGREEPATNDGDAFVDAASPMQAGTCGIADTTHLSSIGIGELRVGVPVSAVQEKCKVVSDTVETDAEGMPQRVLLVDLGRDRVRALVAENQVWRIEIDGGSFRTADSLGVGVTLARLLATPGTTAIEGDGLLYGVVPSHCGLSFRLSHVPEATELHPDWSAEDLGQLPVGTEVDRVLVTGCGNVSPHNARTPDREPR